MRLNFQRLTGLCLLAFLWAVPTGARETETVRLPEAKGEPVLLDGLFSDGEWNDALQKDLGSGIRLYLKKSGGHVFIGVRFSPFKGSIADLFISPDGRTITHLHASAQVGERRVQETSGEWDNPEFIWGDTSEWQANEIRWNQQRMDQLIKEGQTRDSAQFASMYRYDGFEFQIKASKFKSNTWLLRVAAPVPPDWNHPIVYPAGTSMAKTEGWLEVIVR